jgi:hypothetical protein
MVLGRYLDAVFVGRRGSDGSGQCSQVRSVADFRRDHGGGRHDGRDDGTGFQFRHANGQMGAPRTKGSVASQTGKR